MNENINRPDEDLDAVFWEQRADFVYFCQH